jgi:hypothetical protein
VTPVAPSLMARCGCCRRTLPRVDCPGGTCHTCAASCTWGQDCQVRRAGILRDALEAGMVAPGWVLA